MKKRFATALCAGVVVAFACGQAEAAGGKAWSAHKVAALFSAKHFKVDDVRRKGATYVVVADGPKGNKVLFVIDGRTGSILGMDVIRWAPGARRVKRGSHGAGFFDEFYEFGVTVPVATYETWTEYTVEEWTVTTEEYVELTTEEYSEEVTTEEVSYEESVEEVTETTAEEETVEESSSDEDSSDSQDDDDASDPHV